MSRHPFNFESRPRVHRRNQEIERFSNECLETKTSAIILPITVGVKNTTNQSKLEAKTCNRCQAREQACHIRILTVGLERALNGG